MRKPDAVASPALISIDFESDNGTVPPPYRRSLHIHVDACGNGVVGRQLGYDLTAPGNRFDTAFTVARDRWVGFAKLVDELAVFAEDWTRAVDTPTGGPLTHLTLRRGDTQVVIPPYPRKPQQELAESVRGAVRELVPEAAVDAYRAWEAAHGGEE